MLIEQSPFLLQVLTNTIAVFSMPESSTDTLTRRRMYWEDWFLSIVFAICVFQHLFCLLSKIVINNY